MSTDTACSSSLVAVHLAHGDLMTGLDFANIAAGVNVMLLPETTASICGLGALSRVARCQTFDASADGYGISHTQSKLCPTASCWLCHWQCPY